MNNPHTVCLLQQDGNDIHDAQDLLVFTQVISMQQLVRADSKYHYCGASLVDTFRTGPTVLEVRHLLQGTV